MIKIYLVTLLLLVVSSSSGTNYYLSNTGNDANSGTSASDPWQTISKLNTVTFQPGDSVFFEAGNIFRGEIIVTNGGNDAAKIYFGKYGIGNLPVISGAEGVSGWTNYIGNIYRATFTQIPAHLFANDKQMVIARYPNSGFLTYQIGIGNTGFIDTSLIQPTGYWNGATVIMRTTDQTWEARPVDSFANDTIILQSPTNSGIDSGYGYYFNNLLLIVDTVNEWYYNSINQEFYFIAPGNVDPSSLNTEASLFDYGIHIQNGSSNITVENIQFEKQRKTGIFLEDSGSNILIWHCSFLLQGESGIRSANGSFSSSIINNSFSDINGIAISLNSAHNAMISENVIRRIGLVAGYGLTSSMNNMMGIEINTSDSNRLFQNTFDSTGNGGISIVCEACVIEKNIFNHNFLLLNNGGVITQANPNNQGNTIQDNFIFSPVGNNEATPGNPIYTSGILLSDSCLNCTIEHNTIVETSGTGILLNPASIGYSLHRNLIYGCKESQIKFLDGISLNTTHNNQVTGNVFYAIDENQDIVRLESSFEAFKPALFDSNYYFNPYDFFANHKLIFFVSDATNFRSTLHEWQVETNDNSHSISTYFWRNRYSMVDSLGTNLIANGQFTNNFDGWTIAVPGNVNMLLDNSTPLDFGCLKIWKDNTIPYHEGSVISNGFNIDSGNYYTVKISNYSKREGNVRLYLSTSDPPYNGIGFSRYFPSFIFRQNYETIFQAPQSNTHGRLEVFITYKDSIVWIDNISINLVTATYHDPKKLSRLFFNPTDLPAIFNLADSIFFNLDSSIVSNQLIVAPYSSTVLIFDSALILNMEPLIENKFIKLFPNPVMRGSRIVIQSFEAVSKSTQLRLIDMVGKVWINNQIKNMPSNFELPIPATLPAGIYLLQLSSDKQEYIANLLIE